jgi:Uma2 family endonuclease
LPAMCEDEGQEDMGDSNPHTTAIQLLHLCLHAHFADQPELQVFANMNLYYDERQPEAPSSSYVSPDIMVVRPFVRLGRDLVSYKIGREGPPPLLAMEVLSRRSAQQRDLGDKLRIYAGLGVEEYILVDTTGEFLPERLRLLQLRANRQWQDERDADGGVTSQLGFRVVFDEDDELTLVNAETGRHYVRPYEADQVLKSAQARLRELESELARLKAAPKKPPRRRKKK